LCGVQSLAHIVQVLDPDGNGSINFVQFSEGVKRILELQGSYLFIVYTSECQNLFLFVMCTVFIVMI